MSLKQDRKRTAKIVVVTRGHADRDKLDISGYDTKNGRKIKATRKVRKGPRGGKYVIYHGRKYYL